MNLGKIVWLAGNIPVIGQILRYFVRRYPEGSVVTMRYGYAAGYKWKRSHRYVNGYWIGHYELPVQEAIVRELSPGDIFFDVGANAGFFTLVAAKRVGSSGKCVAFEPLPDNAKNIIEQVRLNGLGFCFVVEEALSSQEGVTNFFYDTPGTSTAHLGDIKAGERAIAVKTTTLDKAIQQWGLPVLIKMDIEGGEIDALKGATTLLEQKTPKFLIELHGPVCEEKVRHILSNYGYSFFDLSGKFIEAGKPLPSHIVAKKPDKISICD